MTAAPVTIRKGWIAVGWDEIRLAGALMRAGFRRYATYRQATVAAVVTNSVFGFLRCYVLLAAAASSGQALTAGYDAGQLALYTWVSQGLIGVVALWGMTELAERIRSGEVVADLLRPVHPVVTLLYADLGRAGIAVLTRFIVPMACGAAFFAMHAPRRPQTYPLFVLSAALAVVVCFAARFLVNATAYWLLDVQGVMSAWGFATTLLAGLAFPLHFLPGWLVTAIWVGTPFPSMLQAPLDVIVERGSTPHLLLLVAGQGAWAAVLLGLCGLVQARATAKLVIQGG